MTRMAHILRWRDHAAAVLAALATAHAIGLVELAGWVPHGQLAPGGPFRVLLGAAVCGIVYALVVGLLYRRRLVAGPLYRCGETRPAEDFGKPYHPSGDRLLESWQYR